MAAHAASTAPAPLVPTPTGRTIGSSASRLLWGLAGAITVVLFATNGNAVAATAHAACTYATQPGTTCGEALWLLGYPS